MTTRTESPALLTATQLDELRTAIERRSGILFDSSRERFFSSRIREHMAERQVADGDALLQRVRRSNAEYDALLECLLTQETSFLRYPAVYDALRNRVLPELHIKKFWSNPRTLRIWSAGCSTGEEPYSIAITVSEALDFAEAWDIEILATEISQKALRHAERGHYSRRNLGSLTPQQIETFFAASGNTFTVRPRLRRMVKFNVMNLAQSIYLGRMDCIFCMNVLIYFSEEQRVSLLRRFYECLEPGGYLILGHAESLTKVSVNFESIRRGDCILYRKPVTEIEGRKAALVEGGL
jgi:chemotaxis protein methyltransferase CheR